MNRPAGFNFIECMIVLIIISIVTSFSMSLFRSYMRQNESIVFIHQFVNLLENARVSAVMQHEIVTVCASLDSKKCEGQWENGVIAFTDVDGSGEFKIGDKKLSKIGTIEKKLVIHWKRKKNLLQFSPSGNVRFGNGTFILENVLNRKKRYFIVVSMTGRVRLYY
ncbi:MAG: GspH/FimT family pseudopilin [Gammaproteobacteria bacterium]